MLSSSAAIVADDHIFLNGRPPLTEYLGFVMSLALDGDRADRSALAEQWRVANDRVHELELSEAGYADNVQIGELGALLAPLANAALMHPAVQQSYALMPISIGMIELDRLVVHQKAINLGQVARIKDTLGESPSAEDVFRTAFPLDRSLDPPFGHQQGGNGWTFVSPSNDFRFLNAQLVEPANVAGLVNVPGSPVAMMVLTVGYSVNVLAAARIDGRLLLTNGSHRAFALRDSGITHAPCLIQDVSRREEVEILGVDALVQSGDAYLTAPRPPVLKDYFDPELRIAASVLRKDRHVQVAFNVTPMDLPAPPR